MKLVTYSRGEGSRTAALVHGNSMSHDIWREFADILIRDHDLSLVLVDLRGHGRSPRAKSYAIKEFAQDLVDTLPTDLDFLIGHSLGGVVSALAAPSLRPRHYIGLDPAFDITLAKGLVLLLVGPHQSRLPGWFLGLLGQPPAGAPPDTMERFRASWRNWDSGMMWHFTRESRPLIPAGPPAVPSTLVLADKSFVVSKAMARSLEAAGWDVRVKPGAVHDLQVQDPEGLAALLADVLLKRE
ncbi:alpha/beta fold hydrolase [Streptomyces sp. NPDC058401]|uniref:alpha/beta fold hydrolase n=1 Tax=Streptomyces sp. NPDC058401 TaxID=3346480 RepID=UPI00365B260B